jgi:phosphate/sulfate permease
MAMVTVVINTFFIVYKGAKFLELDDMAIEECLAWAFGLGGGVGIICFVVINPIMFRKIEAEWERVQLERAEGGGAVSGMFKKPSDFPEKQPRVIKKGIFSIPQRIFYAVSDHLTVSLNHDNEQLAAEDEIVAAIHANAEVFDEKTELALRPLQVLTACLDSFSHGANDVANSVGPFAAIVTVYSVQRYLHRAWRGYGYHHGFSSRLAFVHDALPSRRHCWRRVLGRCWWYQLVHLDEDRCWLGFDFGHRRFYRLRVCRTRCGCADDQVPGLGQQQLRRKFLCAVTA